MSDQVVLAIDIGGTKIYGMIYDLDTKSVLNEYSILTQANQGIETVYANIVTLARSLLIPEVRHTGVAWPGFVDSQAGKVCNAINIPGFEEFPLVEKLQSDLGIPIKLENDARLFTYGEVLSRPKPPSVCLGIIIGTGMGSGLVIDGEMYRGAHNFAGEIGHIHHEGETLDFLISGQGVMEVLQPVFDFGDLSEQAEIATEKILPVIQSRLDLLIEWLANMSFLFNPEEIVIGGGTGRYFWRRFESEINNAIDIKLKKYPNRPMIRFSDLDNAGAIGAAYYAKK